MSIREKLQKLFGRQSYTLSGAADPRYRTVTDKGEDLSEVNNNNLAQAHETMLGHLANLGFKESNSFVTGDPYQAIYNMAKYEISLKGGKERLMPINLYERAQNLKEIAGTSSHERGGERIYALELAEILEESIKKWGKPGSTKVLSIKQVKIDLEQMSYEKSAKLFSDQLRESLSARVAAANAFIDRYYEKYPDPLKQKKDKDSLLALRVGPDPYTMSAIDGLHLCGDKTGDLWRAYTGQKPVFK